MTDERTAINLAAALKLADAGLPVFAAIVTYDEKGRGWEKQPAFKGWQKELNHGSGADTAMVAGASQRRAWN